ncbi:YjcZ family sporulation protein [Amphibacillus sediminis]|nr:YjcZ family sporulation protein [Amphibacillus sediminis]
MYYGGGCGCHYPSHGGYGGGFALIVVLFILLIIVGASFYC